MDNLTKVDVFFRRWEPYHRQIVSIAIIYAYDQVRSVNFQTSFSPVLPTTPLPDSIPPTIDDVKASELGSNPAANQASSNPSTLTDDSEESKTNPHSSQPPNLNSSAHHRQSSSISSLRSSILTSHESEGEDEKAHEEWIQVRDASLSSWLKFILDSFKVDPASLPENPQLEDLVELSKHLPASIHLEIIHDLVILSLSASHSIHPIIPSKKSTQQSPHQDLRYSALNRQLVFLVADGLGIDSSVVYGAEKLVAQELFFIFQKSEEAQNANATTEADRLAHTSELAVKAAASKKRWLRYVGAGAGVIVGGVAIGLTGGLAAPVLAPFLIGISGGALGFLATSGGAVLIGTLFGLAGGGLAGYRAQRRLGGITEFGFELLPSQTGEEVDLDLPQIPSLHTTIVSSGFLLTPTDYKDPWVLPFSKSVDRRDVYALKVETQTLLSTGKDLEHFARDTLLQNGATEIIRHTVLASVCTALLLPASIYKAAVMALDNEYQIARDICENAGILLADMIEQEAHGARPLTLIGSGMGSITIFRAILELSRRGGDKTKFMIDQVILICSPLSPTSVEWKTVRRMVSRRLVNVYSKNDWVLTIMARLHSLLSTKMTVQVAGLMDLGLPHVTSVDVSDLVHGHFELNSKIPQILDRIGVDR